LWAKNRVDDVCDPSPFNYLAARFPNRQFVSTFGKDLPNTTITGRIPLEQLRPLIQQAGVYLASVEETGGITVMEAMACGVPPLASRKGANIELVSHLETGYLYDDLEDMEQGLEYCFANRERLGMNARQYIIDNHQWEQVIGGYLEAYQAALVPPPSIKVSVVITAYNYEKLLPRSIESVMAQTIPNWELIIVDDNSPDRCGEIADDYAKQDERIKVIHNPRNLYLAEARNQGFLAARGQYFLALDADDQLPDYTLELLSQALDKDPDIHIATGAMSLIEEDGRKWTSKWPWEEPDFRHQIAQKNQIPYSSMYRRELWERTGGYRRRMRTAEDADFWTRAMSFGGRPAKVISKPTLIYTNHQSSMSHTEAPVNWTEWFPWAAFEHMLPFGNSGRTAEGHRNVQRYGPPEISVIVPVGPGHDILLQDCLDSLVAQTFMNWEVIVINDTGKSWADENGKLNNFYLAGFPFAKILNLEGSPNRGTAWARNRGLEVAQAPYTTFLDADDYLQIPALDLLYKTVTQFGGWVYIDWYDQEGTHKRAKEWEAENLVGKAIGPITGIYSTKDLITIGGFDESLPGWEDWDLHLNLLEYGICGSRLPIPLMTYRYHTGINRERDFAHKSELVHNIKEKHRLLISKGDHFMGCKKCPGGGGRKNLSVSRTGGNRALSRRTSQPKEQEQYTLVEIAYVGVQKQLRRVKSKVEPRRSYRYGETRRNFFVLAGDLEWMLAMKDFVEVKKAEQTLPPESNLNLPTLKTERTPDVITTSKENLPLELLSLPKEIISILGRHYDNIGQVELATVAELIQHKQIGPKRAEKIKEAVKNAVS
jgi:glycosyltransferase involved in cell wall biosynthesis